MKKILLLALLFIFIKQSIIAQTSLLNQLFEYNNQTVLMDSTRGKPIHFSNNVK